MTRDGKEKVTCRSKDDRSMSLILAMGRLWDTWLPMYQFAKQIMLVYSSSTCKFENRLDDVRVQSTILVSTSPKADICMPEGSLRRKEVE
jgi:hypothetical protein